MKKIIVSFLLVGILIFTVTACASKEERKQSKSISTEETQSTQDETKNNFDTEISDKETESVIETEIETSDETPMQAPEEETALYTYTEMDAIKYAKISVNVRNQPEVSGEKLGGLNINDEVHVTGQCNETGWYRFEYNGAEAYVSNNYLVDEQVTVEQYAPTQSSSNWSDGFEHYVWYDMGDYFFCIVDTLEDSYHYTFCDEANANAQILRERYPDRDACYGGNGPREGHIALVSAITKLDNGYPNWDSVHYAWE